MRTRCQVHLASHRFTKPNPGKIGGQNPSDQWLRLQGFRDQGRECATYGTRPCNLKSNLIDPFRKQPACEKDNAQQDVNAVVGLAEVKCIGHKGPHAVNPDAERHS